MSHESHLLRALHRLRADPGAFLETPCARQAEHFIDGYVFATLGGYGDALAQMEAVVAPLAWPRATIRAGSRLFLRHGDSVRGFDILVDLAIKSASLEHGVVPDASPSTLDWALDCLRHRPRGFVSGGVRSLDAWLTGYVLCGTDHFPVEGRSEQERLTRFGEYVCRAYEVDSRWSRIIDLQESEDPRKGIERFVVEWDRFMDAQRA